MSEQQLKLKQSERQELEMVTNIPVHLVITVRQIPDRDEGVIVDSIYSQAPTPTNIRRKRGRLQVAKSGTHVVRLASCGDGILAWDTINSGISVNSWSQIYASVVVRHGM